MMRALVVTNMYPSSARPALGSFVRDQVRALQQLDGLDVELYAFAPGGTRTYARAARDLRRRFGGARFDIVHAHFGLTAWPSLAVDARHRVVTLHGNDLYHPRSRPVTKAVLGRMDLIGTPTREFAARVPGAGVRRKVAILPCGVDVERFRPIDRRAARKRLGLDLDGRYVLFPYDPARATKRADRARQLVGDDAQLLTLGAIPPRRSRTGSTPLTPSSARPIGRRSGWPASRRSHATCRCSRGRPEHTPKPSTGSPARTARSGIWSPGARRSHPICRVPIHASPDVPERSSTRPKRWPSASPQPGAGSAKEGPPPPLYSPAQALAMPAPGASS